MKMRTIITLTILVLIALAAGYHLLRTDLEAVAAVPPVTPGKASLSVQATTLAEVEARQGRAVTSQMTGFTSDVFDYQLVYPLGWETVKLSGNQMTFRAPDGMTQVMVEAVGPLAADGLAAFVNRSLGSDIVLTRQSLTVHGLQAERVIAHSDKIGGQVTRFFIDAGASAYVVTGVGEQKAIEMIARSFNGPQPVAQR